MTDYISGPRDLEDIGLLSTVKQAWFTSHPKENRKSLK